MLRKIGSGCIVAMALLSTPARAMAEAEPFGAPGRVVITNAFANALFADRVWGGPLAVNTTSIGLRPGADMFIVRGFSLGAHIGYSRTWTDTPSFDSTQDDLLWGPSLGYAWNLSERLTLWPNLAADFIVSWRHGNSGFETDEPITRAGYGTALPVIFHVVPHFFVGIGPSFWIYTLGGSDRASRISASTMIGGWF